MPGETSPGISLLDLNRDKIVHFINPASKNQIPYINSYPMSIYNLKIVYQGFALLVLVWN
jgi:hypothetical protein